MKRLLAAAMVMFGVVATAPAVAGVDINIGIGVPGVIYTTPNHPRHGHYPRPHYSHSPGVIVTQPHVVVVPGGVYYGDQQHYRPHGRYDRHDGYRNKHKGKRHYHHKRGKHHD